MSVPRSFGWWLAKFLLAPFVLMGGLDILLHTGRSVSTYFACWYVLTAISWYAEK